MVDAAAATPAASPTFRLADTLLEGKFRSFVASRREAGLSWRRVSNELRDATDRQVDVTPETLRTWFADLQDPAA